MIVEHQSCDCCKRKDKCKVKNTFTPLGCSSGFEMNADIKEYDLDLVLNVKVLADSEESAFKQLYYDIIENRNPCVSIKSQSIIEKNKK